MSRKILHGICIYILICSTGCTTHYRHALEQYRAKQPVPFYQKTQEWAKASQEKQEQPPAPPSAPKTTPESTLSSEDMLGKVTATVLDVPQEEARRQFAKLANQEALKQRLAKEIDWTVLLFAVAQFNPAVHSARDRWQATLYQYSQADYLEGLLTEFRTFTRYLNVETGEPLQKEMEQEFFPYPSTIALKGELVREQARIAELEWQYALRDALVDAGNAYFDYQYQYRAEATSRDNVALLENLVDVVQKRYQTGLASQADLLKAQTELERQRNLVRDFAARQKTDAAQINALVDLPAATPLGKPQDADLPYKAPSLKTLDEAAAAHRQELLIEQAKVARTEIAIRLGEVMNRPLSPQGYSNFERGMMPEAAEGPSLPPFGMQAKNTTPRPGYAQAEAYLAEMRQRLRAEQATANQVEVQTKALARTALDNLDIACRQFGLVKQTVMPQEQSANEIAVSAYTAGSMSFLDLLDTERALIQAKLELEQSRKNLNLALIRLATVRGVVSSK